MDRIVEKTVDGDADRKHVGKALIEWLCASRDQVSVDLGGIGQAGAEPLRVLVLWGVVFVENAFALEGERQQGKLLRADLGEGGEVWCTVEGLASLENAELLGRFVSLLLLLAAVVGGW